MTVKYQGAQYVEEMDPVERRYSEAMHDMMCDELPKLHPLDDHEPFETDGIVPWADFQLAMARRGLTLVIDTAYCDDHPHNHGWLPDGSPDIAR